MICPNCGENNPDTYKFCGMCGNALTSAPTAAEKPLSKAAAEQPHTSATHANSLAFSRMEPRGTARAATATTEESGTSRTGVLHEAYEPAEPIAGPSLLGLNQPTPDSIRETTFRGMTTYYPEERHPAWGRILLTLIFIAGLVAVGWWRYKNYGVPGHGMPAWLSAMNKTSPPGDNPRPDLRAKPENRNANQNADQSKTQGSDQSNGAASGEAPASADQASDSATPAGEKKAGGEKTSEDKPADSKSADSNAAKPADQSNQPDESASTSARNTKTAKADKAARASAGDEDSAPAAKLKPAAASTEGDGLFRKGEAYLYGRGVTESCAQAIRYLKSASDKSNVKARSAFGTMYATGHCVPRDLPTSYRWFAMALQADPNNSILEKDLSAIWNQMTPPERQLATKIKPSGE